MTDATKIRAYPTNPKSVAYDLPNQILHDLRHTFGHRAVAKQVDGEIIDWYAHHGVHNRVVCWWPDYYDEPVWNAESVYSFGTPLKSDSVDYCFVMYEWPDELDKDAQVIL